MTKTIVVTGGGGFIGCNLVAELNSRGYSDLIIVDSMGADDKWRNLIELQFEDILTPQRFLALIEQDRIARPEAIFHLGACSSTTERDVDYLLENNYRYSRTLCEWSLRHEVRFIYASSAATYGDGSGGYSDDDSALHTLKPLNMYGYSKHMFDVWAQRHQLFDCIAGMKYFNVFGPHEDHKADMRSVVHKAYGQIRDTGTVRLFKSYRTDYADGEQQRDFIYVKDAVAVTLHFLEDRVSGLFNCGTGLARSWKDLVNAVFAALGLAPQIEFIDMPEKLRGKYQYFTQADMSKLRRAGYNAPFTSLEDAVRDYVRSYLAKRDYGEAQ
jgi:ADP-L-glycero-D-manno-heptose 6-epimerase